MTVEVMAMFYGCAGLNPVERIWLYRREHVLSHRRPAHRNAVMDTCCNAWSAPADQPERIRSFTAYPNLQKVSA